MSGHKTAPAVQCARAAPRSRRQDIEELIALTLSSMPMRILCATLGKLGLVIEPVPILHKYLSGSFLRLIFPVTGGPIEDGAVVSVVCLYETRTGQALYAHPMHAGPGVNPMLKAMSGPMADPKAQPGADGNRATMRIMGHKLALWDRFSRERTALGDSAAGRRWRDGYYWSLKRLYFCNRCTQCKWGNPFFDGPDPAAPRRSTVLADAQSAATSVGRFRESVTKVLSSDAWRTELTYVRRGGFEVCTSPRLLKQLPHDQVQILFPTNAFVLQEGTPVGVAVTYDRSSKRAVFAHHLSFGADAEVQFLHGERALGLQCPQPGTAGEAAKTVYRSWRRDAWLRFWLDELESGLEYASAQWLGALWSALETLFGGNDLRREAEGGTARLLEVRRN